jgi:hypothetical protein
MTGAAIAFTNTCALDSWAAASKLSGDEDTRIKRIAAELKERGVQIIGANELVTYQNAEVFSKAMGWGGRLGMVKGSDGKYNGKIDLTLPESSGVLKGSGHPGVAMGWIWNPDILQPYWAKEVDTYPGWGRNRWSMAMRAFLGGKRLGLQLFHLEFEPKGDNSKASYYNGIRHKQVDFGLDTSMSPNQSWFVGGDWNHASNDKPDSPGDAGRDHGLVNVDTGNIIRAMKTKDITNGKPYMVPLGKNTDHPALIIPNVVVPK